LSLPGEGDHLAGGTDVRNYGGGAGLPELRSIFAELLGVDADRLVAQDNASLSIMYDLLTFAMLFGTPDSGRPWKDEPQLRWLCPVPGYDRHFAVTQAMGIEMRSEERRVGKECRARGGGGAEEERREAVGG